MSNLTSPQSNQQFNPPQFDSFYKNDEIDLRELFCALWSGKLWIIGFTLFCGLSAGLFAYIQPNVYQVSATFRIDADPYNFVESRGYNAGGQLAQEVNNSLPFLTSPQAKSAIADLSQQSIEQLNGLSISKGGESNIIVTKQSIFPERAFESVSLYTMNINTVLKANELEKVQSVIKATEPLIESQQGRVRDVIAEKYADLLFKQAILQSPTTKLVQVITEPVVPTIHVKPKRALIVVLGTLLGGMLGVAIVLIRFAFRREDNITE